MKKHAVCVSLIVWTAAACGGAPARTPIAAEGADRDKDSIADLAAAQGGISSLGHGNTGSNDTAAFGGTLRAEDVDPKTPVKLDGVLREWPPRVAAKTTIAGTTEGLSLNVSIQVDDTSLYVAAEIEDAHLSRSARHGEHDDHVSLTLAFPAGRGALKAYEIGFFPGKPGETSGATKWLSGPLSGQPVHGAKLVEADDKAGVTFEAALPWTSFPEARSQRVGLRAALRYHDGDGKGGGVLGTGPGSVEHPQELSALPTASEQAVIDGLLTPRGLLNTAPRFDVFADITGDERKERVSVFGNFFSICGPGYRSGHQFFWRELTGELTSFDLRDLTADGKDDMIVRRKQASGGGGATTHETVEVWTIAAGDEPSTVFTHEVGIFDASGKRHVTNNVRLSGKEIEVSVGPAVGWDAASFHEPIATGDTGLLLPWGTVKSRSFKLDNGIFAKSGEITKPGSAPATPPNGSTPSPKPEVATVVPKPATTNKGNEGTNAVLDAYFRDQNVSPGTKPRFDLAVHVDEDPRPERVVLFGRDIVVLGTAFKSGTGYVRMSLTQFTDDKDIRELMARDLTGDGAAELIVRGVRHVSPPGGGAVVDIEGLFVYRVRGGNLSRVFAIETGREQSNKRMQGLVQFVPAKGGTGFDVEARPGAARGWTEQTYPWPQEKSGGAMEPLLLPWGGATSTRYSWNGAAFAPR